LLKGYIAGKDFSYEKFNVTPNCISSLQIRMLHIMMSVNPDFNGHSEHLAIDVQESKVLMSSPSKMPLPLRDIDPPHLIHGSFSTLESHPKRYLYQTHTHTHTTTISQLSTLSRTT